MERFACETKSFLPSGSQDLSLFKERSAQKFAWIDHACHVQQLIFFGSEAHFPSKGQDQ